MSPLPLKIFLISLICITNMVVVNTGPVTRVQKTAADNLLAKRDGPLIGYFTFLKEEDAVLFKGGKFPDMQNHKGEWFPYPIYSHPGSNSTSAKNAMQTASSSAVVITPVHSSSKSELQMFVPKSLLTKYPPSVDCLIGEDEAIPVANWRDLKLNLPDQYDKELGTWRGRSRCSRLFAFAFTQKERKKSGWFTVDGLSPLQKSKVSLVSKVIKTTTKRRPQSCKRTNGDNEIMLFLGRKPSTSEQSHSQAKITQQSAGDDSETKDNVNEILIDKVESAKRTNPLPTPARSLPSLSQSEGQYDDYIDADCLNFDQFFLEAEEGCVAFFVRGFRGAAAVDAMEFSFWVLPLEAVFSLIKMKGMR
ncbi:hypothetical protein DFJ43DRAFT_1038204 [Lentinula guzmanii]|uniref:Uncharacterized protein n=1 Tax=Lentinula guzmanii TaxID=2804957 RepID=A0AA38MUV7_9AGAR|nr:hypothetical protein DFJ43DRAFT_1038204 [Lentinula guzmanii]